MPPPDDLAARPLPTSHFASVRDFSIARDATYVFAQGEERSHHVTGLRERCPGATFLDLVDQTRDDFKYRTVEGSEEHVALRGPKQLADFWEQNAGSGRCYVDLTGMTHSVWAALVKSAFAAGIPFVVVYVEPLSYTYNKIGDPSKDMFRLTKEFEGLAPLPGFVNLADPPEAKEWFVPLLGFEGRRFSHMREEVAPAKDRTVPVIGVPGYRPEFVGSAYHGNEQPLTDEDSWLRVEFATANCPFSVYHRLSEILGRDEQAFLKVAPIGTRPQALGAVLFALAHPDDVEILYDHPVEFSERTAGHSRLLVYDVTVFNDLEGRPIKHMP